MDFGGKSHVDVPIIEVDAALGHQSGRHGKASATGWAPQQLVVPWRELVVELVGHEEIHAKHLSITFLANLLVYLS